MSFKKAKVCSDYEQETETQAWTQKPEHVAGRLKDRELVARAQEGDQWAIEELVCRYQQKAFAIAFQMCSGDRMEAEDFTQAAFFSAFRNIKKFRGKSSFYTWFYRIVVNTCLDGRRRKQRRKRLFAPWRPRQRENENPRDPLEALPDTDGNSNPLDVLSGEQLAGEIQKTLERLPEKQQTVFQLKVLHGMNIKEIAQIMQVAEGTVKSHLFRATHYVRNALKDWVES